MPQTFKSIYLPDKQQKTTNRRLTLAFGSKDRDLLEAVKPYSSQELREVLGYSYFSDLKRDASKEALPVNAFCLGKIRKQITVSNLGKYQPSAIDPVHSTFKGGKKDPLHNWYPYLEGYSPQFVEAILDKYSPVAKTVYDPFCGAGTTALVAAQRGLNSLYSEVNPLLNYITEAKIAARELTIKGRASALANLMRIQDLGGLLASTEPDQELQQTYTATFGKSRFFDKKTHELVLKARSLADEIACTSPVSAQFFTVAVLRTLIPASLLQRAGDLRFKTKSELMKKKVDFVEGLDASLQIVISDLQNVSSLHTEPIQISDDAKNIARVSPLSIDTVITSPPYLNGTNYFRNTKVELWFLRSLLKSSDLSSFRDRAVTSGINDVTGRDDRYQLPSSIRRVVTELEKNPYDRRIPRMVTQYFEDMGVVFSGLRKHLTKNATVAIDIGDSLYGDTHVPTDKLLTKLLEDLGYQPTEQVSLRKRTSRNGRILKQVLLTFKFVGPIPKTTTQKKWERSWESFKTEQLHQQYPYSKRNWGHPLHSLCSYQGKMKPSLANQLVTAFTKPGDRLLDPFAGVGTIPFEGALNGALSYGFDISPAAFVIGEAKLGTPTQKECDKLINTLDKFIRSNGITEGEIQNSKEFGFNQKISDYYEKQTLKEILLARRYFNENPPLDASAALVVSSVLHILHGNRPYALSRRSHPITPFAPTGDYEYRPLIPRLRDKVARNLAQELPEDFVPGKMFFQDATLNWPQEVHNLDAIITSPPFFDSTRFHLGNWIRLWFCGWENREFLSKPLAFVDERQKLTFDVYKPILRQSRERLKPGGVVVFHLGKSRKCDMAEELSKLASQWFKVEDVFSENVEHTEKHGLRDKGTVVEHQYLVLS